MGTNKTPSCGGLGAVLQCEHLSLPTFTPQRSWAMFRPKPRARKTRSEKNTCQRSLERVSQITRFVRRTFKLTQTHVRFTPLTSLDERVLLQVCRNGERKGHMGNSKTRVVNRGPKAPRKENMLKNTQTHTHQQSEHIRSIPVHINRKPKTVGAWGQILDLP